ncbi:polysaccharide biosynthesis/export family protein [Ferruginibacter sp. SUN002]|uniref:polysaccharide biosynthesis/export family protein n=1 Tax=Ferruginibacter sp. SUN002 TaxID=2937789 RepID=UPI003D365D1F
MYNLFSFAKSPVLRFNSILLAISFLVVIFSSCKTTYTNANSFKTLTKDTTISAFVNERAELKIQKGDILTISITSLNANEDVLFNSTNGNSSSGHQNIIGYYLDKEGNIELHKLGIIHVEGMTTKALQDRIAKDLAPYLKDPIVKVGFQNHKVTILGQVKTAQQVNLDKSDQISVLDLIAISGDLTADADKKNILIIRDSGENKQVKKINLEDHSIFSSPWFYLKPNDVLYVGANNKTTDEVKRANRQQTLTIVSSVITITAIIYTTFIRK